MKKTGLLFTSRNNYQLLDFWFQNQPNLEEFSILNIDEDSSEENKSQGRAICEKHGVVYMDREERGMMNNLTTACNYFKSQGLEWIIWNTHDSLPTEGFFNKFDQLVTDKNLNDFGVIGFNILHDGRHLLSRTPLQPGLVYDCYYPSEPLPQKYSKPFAVESAMWTTAAVNISQYETHIKTTGDYVFFHAWDDIAFQFLNKNIYNIALPDFHINHVQGVKPKFNLPLKSPHVGRTGAKDETEREFYYGKWGHLQIWIDRWGFDWQDRNTFESVKDHYKDTLIYEFYNHDRDNSPTPLKSFDL